MSLNSQNIDAEVYKSKPLAVAEIQGSEDYSGIKGKVSFYKVEQGVVVAASIHNLPKTETDIFAFHIHAGSDCNCNHSDHFQGAGPHYNPNNTPHPQHAGDLPPLFGNNGLAWLAVLTDRFQIEDILGRAVIIHLNPDDFTTQPAGNAGTRIACGIVKKVEE